MKFNKWTLGLAAVGVVSLASAARADETNMVMTSLSSTTISGYVDVAAQFNPGGGGSGTPSYDFGNKANGINLNVVDIALDKPQDESPWAAGYHAELWFGPDASTLGTTPGSITYQGNTIPGASANSPAAIRQAYVVLRTPVGNGIDWKVGVFDTIIGYEGTTSGGNPNYSRSFGYNLEPTTHTGILGTYKINDIVTVEAGVADTAYAGSGFYTASYNTGLYLPTFMGLATLTAPDSFGWAKGGTFSAGFITTSGSTAQEPASSTGGFGAGSHGDGATSYYLGLTLPTPVAALKVGGAFDYLNAYDIGAYTWDLAGYSTFQVNDKLSFNLRAEYLNAGGNTAFGTSVNGGAFSTGFPYGVAAGGKQQAQEITATVQYSLWANVLTRVEFRWDHVNHGSGYASAGDQTSSVTGVATQQQDAYLLAVQAIYTF
jgi:hypothetical protein